MTIYVTLDQIRAVKPNALFVNTLFDARGAPRRVPLSYVVEEFGYLYALGIIRRELPADFPYHRLARHAAMMVSSLWPAPPVVIWYLGKGDESVLGMVRCAVMFAQNWANTDSTYFATRAAGYATDSNAASAAAAVAAAMDAVRYATGDYEIFISRMFDSFDPDKQE